MSKILRKPQKIFGSGAGLNQISKFGSLYAGTPEFTTDPELVQSYSNYLTGWFGAAIGGNSPAIEDMNALFFLYAYQLAYTMQTGVPEWDSQTTYYIGSVANDGSGNLFVSITNNNLNNLLTDDANWKPYQSEPTGTGKDFWGSVLPRGYIWASGKTIGAAASGATERANDDTLDLYTLFWNNYSNTLLPIQDSSGVPTTRGGSAAADFAANKRLTIIDKRGRVSAGKDDMGGTSANRLTTAGSGIDGDVLGDSGGSETHALTSGENATHSHGVNDPGHFHYSPYKNPTASGGTDLTGWTPNTGVVGNFSTSTETTGVTTQNSGSSTAHQNTQPTIVCNYIIKL